jgi:Dihydroxyacetone kinase
MKEFKRDDFIKSVECIQKLMTEYRDYLIALDSVIGDGDLGLTMLKSFTAGLETALASADTDLGMLFKKVGFAIAKAAPSTMGTLTATAFIEAGKALAGAETATAETFCGCFTVMAEGVAARGKAKEGDKTLLDVLFPVGRAVADSKSGDLTERMGIAVEQAEISLEKTKEMMNQHGKAAVFREKTIGVPDPGASAALLMILGFAQACGVKRDASAALK